MKYVKMLGMVMAAAATLIACMGTGSAAATELTCTNPPGVKVTCSAGLVVTATSTHIVFHTSVGDVTCEHSHMTFKTDNSGSPTTTVKAPVTFLDFTGCGDAQVTVLKAGTLEFHTHESDPNGKSGWGTLTSSGLEITIKTPLFHCVYTTSNTDIGTVTGSTTTGGAPTINVSGKKLSRTGGSVFCGSSGELTGSYTFISPTWLDVDHAFL